MLNSDGTSHERIQGQVEPLRNTMSGATRLALGRAHAAKSSHNTALNAKRQDTAKPTPDLSRVDRS